jgi:hypothetical protein
MPSVSRVSSLHKRNAWCRSSCAAVPAASNRLHPLFMPSVSRVSSLRKRNAWCMSSCTALLAASNRPHPLFMPSVIEASSFCRRNFLVQVLILLHYLRLANRPEKEKELKPRQLEDITALEQKVCTGLFTRGWGCGQHPAKCWDM